MKNIKQKILEAILKWADRKLIEMRSHDEYKRVEMYAINALRLDNAKGIPLEKLHKYSPPYDPIIYESLGPTDTTSINELTLLDTLSKIEK